MIIFVETFNQHNMEQTLREKLIETAAEYVLSEQRSILKDSWVAEATQKFRDDCGNETLRAKFCYSEATFKLTFVEKFKDNFRQTQEFIKLFYDIHERAEALAKERGMMGNDE